MSRLTELPGVPIDVVGDLGLQRRRQHPPGPLGHQLIENPAQVAAIGAVGDYLQHQAYSFPAGHTRRIPSFRFGRVRRPLLPARSSTTFGYSSRRADSLAKPSCADRVSIVRNVSFSASGNCSVMDFSAAHLVNVGMTESLDRKNSPRSDR